MLIFFYKILVLLHTLNLVIINQFFSIKIIIYNDICINLYKLNL
jgi:hypothetical protein